MICNSSYSKSQIGSYLYADNTCISYNYENFEEIAAALNEEFSSLCYGFIAEWRKCIFFRKQEHYNRAQQILDGIGDRYYCLCII